MNATKLLTMLVAALVIAAGAGAATAVQADADTDTDAAATIDASYDDGTVTVTVTENGSAVENVSVEADDGAVGTTDANGTLTFETNASEELELEFEGESVDREIEYVVEDGELVREADDEEETDSELAADVSYDNGTVEVTVTQNGSAVENATVEADDETVGTTDANGSLTFETNASEEIELEITSGEQELEREYAIEKGELVAEDEESEDEESEERAGPDENASERAHSVFAVVQSWMNGDGEGNLGQMIQNAVDNGNDDAPGNSGDAPGNSGDAPGNSGDAENESDAPGNSGDAPGNSGDAPGHAPDGDDESEDEAADEEESEESESEADDDEESEEEDDDDEHPGNGNGNGNS